jgi:small basic protein
MLDSGPVGEERQPQRSEDSTALQVLATEHWSLLAMRSLTYSESLSRVSMFLSVLAGAVIALALVAQADRFGETFQLISILILSIVLFVGLATVVRLSVLNHDDLLWVMGMNRIRHAYLERHPDLERYFVTTKHDDFRGVARTLGYEATPIRGVGQITHGAQTLPGMVGLIAAVVAGALVSLVARSLGAPSFIVVGAAIGAFLLTTAALVAWSIRSFGRFRSTFDQPRFPSEESPKQQ